MKADRHGLGEERKGGKETEVPRDTILYRVTLKLIQRTPRSSHNRIQNETNRCARGSEIL